MATVVATPNTRKAAKLLEKYTAAYQRKAELKEAYDQQVAPLDKEMMDLKAQLEDWSANNQPAFGEKKNDVFNRWQLWL